MEKNILEWIQTNLNDVLDELKDSKENPEKELIKILKEFGIIKTDLNVEHIVKNTLNSLLVNTERIRVKVEAILSSIKEELEKCTNSQC